MIRFPMFECARHFMFEGHTQGVFLLGKAEIVIETRQVFIMRLRVRSVCSRADDVFDSCFHECKWFHWFLVCAFGEYKSATRTWSLCWLWPRGGTWTRQRRRRQIALWNAQFASVVQAKRSYVRSQWQMAVAHRRNNLIPDRGIDCR